MNACIVGYGAIGPVHAEALMQIDGVELYYEKFGFKKIGVSESVIGNVTWFDMKIEL